MRSKGFAVIAVVAVTFWCVIAYLDTCTAAEGHKVKLRVLYVGHPDSDREKDFVGLLEKHFVKVGKADLEKFEVQDAKDYDVTIADYSGLTIKGNTILTPRMPFGVLYSRPVLTIGAAGALVSGSLGLKTGYL
jgi:hypothetical protein